MDFLTAILILISLITLIYYWLVRSDQISKDEFAKRNLKYVKMTNLFKSALSNEPIEQVRDEVIKREGAAFGFNMLNQCTIMLSDPDIIQTVLSKEFTNFTNRREFPVINKLLVENIFFADGEQWKRLRSIATPAFTVGKLKRMKSCMDETVQTLLKNINLKFRQNQTQNVKTIFEAFTIDTIFQTAFGIKIDSINDPKNPIMIHGQKFFEFGFAFIDMAKIAVMFLFPKVAKFLRLQVNSEATDFFGKLSVDIMNQKRVEYAKTKSFAKATSFIEFMLEADEENIKMGEMGELDENEKEAKKPTKYMTQNEIISQCVLFFIAGFETTSTALTLSAYNLARNPSVQEKLFKEIESVFEKIKLESPEESDPFKLITYDTLPKFEYLSAVINESLRLVPPIIFIERKVERAMDLSNADESIQFNVKEGDIIQIPVYSIHQNPKYFPEPEKFKPERFVGEPKFHKYAYLPFGSGPRNCIAKSMALMEAKLALLHVVRQFKFEICEKTKVPLEFFNQFDLIIPRDVTLKIVKR